MVPTKWREVWKRQKHTESQWTNIRTKFRKNQSNGSNQVEGDVEETKHTNSRWSNIRTKFRENQSNCSNQVEGGVEQTKQTANAGVSKAFFPLECYAAYSVSYRRFGKTHRSYLQGSSSPFLFDCLTLEDGTDKLPRNSGNQQSKLPNISEELTPRFTPRRKPDIALFCP